MTTNERRKDFKKALDVADVRRKRESTTVEIRRARRDDGVQRKRRDFRSDGHFDEAHESPGAGAMPVDWGTPPTGAAARAHVPGRSIHEPVYSEWLQAKINAITEDCEALKSEDLSTRLEAASRFRRLLSIERNPPIAEVIRAGAVPLLVRLLGCHESPQLQFEAAWALTNVASGTSEHTRVVIDFGAVPAVAALLASPADETREQAVWALGNIAGDTVRCRDLVLSYGVVRPLAALLADEHTRPSLLRNATWAVSNLFRGKPPPRAGLVAPALGPLQRLAFTRDEEVSVDVCWAFAYMSDSVADETQGDPGARGPGQAPVVHCGAATAAAPLSRSFAEGGGPCADGAHYVPPRYAGTALQGADVPGALGPAFGAGPHGTVPGLPDSGRTPQTAAEAVTDLRTLHRLAALAAEPSMQPVQTPVLRVLGNLAAGDQRHTDCIVAAGALHALAHILEYPDGGPAAAHYRGSPAAAAASDGAARALTKEVLWILSNMAASASRAATAEMIRMAPLVVRLLLDDNVPFDIRREAGWALGNLVLASRGDHAQALAGGGAVLRALARLLPAPDPELVRVSLDALSHLLDEGAQAAGQGRPNPHAHTLDEIGGVDALEALQEHPNEGIYARAVAILERHLGAQDEGADGGLQPQVVNGGFAFGLGQEGGAPLSFGPGPGGPFGAGAGGSPGGSEPMNWGMEHSGQPG